MAIGFLLGWLVALATRMWQVRIDEHAQRYDDIRNTLLNAADIATAYWLKLQTLSDPEAEAKLIGLYVLLNGLAVEVAAAYNDDRTVHGQRLQGFYDLTTGLDPRGFNVRQPDAARAQAVQSEAAELILYFQDYRRRKLTIRSSLRIGFLPR